MTPARKDIRTLTKDELRTFFKDKNIPVFKGDQVYEWLWSKAAQSFDSMTNLSLAHRDLLEEHFVINHIEVDQQQRSNDGTIKNAVNRIYRYLIINNIIQRNVMLIGKFQTVKNFIEIYRNKNNN